MVARPKTPVKRPTGGESLTRSFGACDNDQGSQALSGREDYGKDVMDRYRRKTSPNLGGNFLRKRKYHPIHHAGIGSDVDQHLEEIQGRGAHRGASIAERHAFGREWSDYVHLVELSIARAHEHLGRSWNVEPRCSGQRSGSSRAPRALMSRPARPRRRANGASPFLCGHRPGMPS